MLLQIYLLLAILIVYFTRQKKFIPLYVILFLLIFVVDLADVIIDVNNADYDDMIHVFGLHASNPDEVDIQISDYDDVTVFLGASSLRYPSETSNVPYYYQRLHPETKVYNLALSGSDSDYLVEVLKQVPRADRIFIYSGHNDYANAYFFVADHYLDIYQETLFSKITNPIGNLFFKFTDYHSYARYLDEVIEPNTHNLFYNLGLLKINETGLQKFDQAILNNFKKNMREVERYDADVYFITPISNLESKPSPRNDFYIQGIKESDYSSRIQLLKKAKDQDYFQRQIRAREDMVNYIRTLNVIDIEAELVNRSFSFNDKYFHDYVHFDNRTALWIATQLPN